jgi:alkylresorcinol/alkylpyrone synthase
MKDSYMSSQARLLSLATAVPPYILLQSDVRGRVNRLFDLSAGIDRLLPVFDNAGIDRRHSCVPIDWYEQPHGWTERNALYVENALNLMENVALECVAKAGLALDDIDALIVVSTTGIATPSLDALLIERMHLRRDIRRHAIFGLGCGGGVTGLARAAEAARSVPGCNVLLLVVELCGLTFRKNDLSKGNIVGTALFSDGAAGAIVSCEGDGPAFGASGEYTWPDTLDIMGWDIEEDGLKVRFSRNIPAFVEANLREPADSFLAANGLSLRDIDGFVFHPGGTKVLTAIETALELGPHALDISRAVLRGYGNMSAATILFVLDATLRGFTGKRLLLSGVGPGFTAGFLVMETA